MIQVNGAEGRTFVQSCGRPNAGKPGRDLASARARELEHPLQRRWYEPADARDVLGYVVRSGHQLPRRLQYHSHRRVQHRREGPQHPRDLGRNLPGRGRLWAQPERRIVHDRRRVGADAPGHGPLWVCINYEQHAVVVNGLQSDGTDEGTTFYVTDPWAGPEALTPNSLNGLFGVDRSADEHHPLNEEHLRHDVGGAGQVTGHGDRPVSSPVPGPPPRRSARGWTSAHPRHLTRGGPPPTATFPSGPQPPSGTAREPSAGRRAPRPAPDGVAEPCRRIPAGSGHGGGPTAAVTAPQTAPKTGPAGWAGGRPRSQPHNTVVDISFVRYRC